MVENANTGAIYQPREVSDGAQQNVWCVVQPLTLQTASSTAVNRRHFLPEVVS